MAVKVRELLVALAEAANEGKGDWPVAVDDEISGYAILIEGTETCALEENEVGTDVFALTLGYGESYEIVGQND